MGPGVLSRPHAASGLRGAWAARSLRVRGISHEADEGIPAGRLFTLDPFADPAHRVRIVLVDVAQDLPMFVLGFATAANGELFVLANVTGTLAGHTGVPAEVIAG